MRSNTARIALIVATGLVLGAGIWWFGGLGGGSTDKQLIVLSFGGPFAEAQRGAYMQPFAASTGVPVVDESYNGEYGKLKAAVESGNVPWSVVDMESSALLRGKKDGILLKLDLGQINRSDLIPAAVDEYAVGTDLYSVAMGFNTQAFPATGPQPASWADFWDVERFPGKRTMKKDPRFTLEIALMADGVPLDQVYADGQLDVERAFRSLNRIKPHVSVWWTTGQQPIQLLADGEVALAAAFGARIHVAQHEGQAPVQVVWNQGILDVEYWAILRGAPHVDLAQKFIDFATQAEPQAAFSKKFPLGPVNLRAFEHMDDQLARQLNTHPDNYSQQLLFNAAFWSENEEQVRERFNAWLGE